MKILYIVVIPLVLSVSFVFAEDAPLAADAVGWDAAATDSNIGSIIVRPDYWVSATFAHTSRVDGEHWGNHITYDVETMGLNLTVPVHDRVAINPSLSYSAWETNWSGKKYPFRLIKPGIDILFNFPLSTNNYDWSVNPRVGGAYLYKYRTYDDEGLAPYGLAFEFSGGLSFAYRDVWSIGVNGYRRIYNDSSAADTISGFLGTDYKVLSSGDDLKIYLGVEGGYTAYEGAEARSEITPRVTFTLFDHLAIRGGYTHRSFNYGLAGREVSIQFSIF